MNIACIIKRERFFFPDYHPSPFPLFVSGQMVSVTSWMQSFQLAPHASVSTQYSGMCQLLIEVLRSDVGTMCLSGAAH